MLGSVWTTGSTNGAEKASEETVEIVEPTFEILEPNNFDEINKLIELAGRTCYKSEARIGPGTAAKMVTILVKRKHHSVLEHQSITVRFVIDRGVSHELVRHRLASFSQESTRYCNYQKKGLQFVHPCFWEEGDPKLDRWRDHMEEVDALYNELINLGAKPEEARSVLPNSLKTELVMTANIREWRHVLTVRTHRTAHPQMREVMIPLLEYFQEQLPELFLDVGVEEPDPTLLENFINRAQKAWKLLRTELPDLWKRVREAK